jgi:hypothetical protein
MATVIVVSALKLLVNLSYPPPPIVACLAGVFATIKYPRPLCIIENRGFGIFVMRMEIIESKTKLIASKSMQTLIVALFRLTGDR